MRKIISMCLVLAYINTIPACSIKTVRQLELSDIDSNDKDIAVILLDLTKYYFESDNYKFKVDSLEGIALTEDSQSLGLKTIAVSDIFQIEEVERQLDGGKVAIFSIVALVTAVGFTAALLAGGSYGGFN